ncbi:glycerophosphodiester phosphodiesterase family protein [Pseudooceanicola onchidii]|uniref:glycerophosphodiester phosphodiesterase family protein n=1 Tax=Pseudooceanicola onchidii TaxID=2562279 RepID=UPI0010A9FCE7|nr:glycerophosphodiester phosphodiesterase family protein [Pseudooceanicola onchidii]
MTAITGHRGARNLWPENSLDGFRRAAALGCDAIELDVHLAADAEILVIHDPTLDRTTGASGPVADLTATTRRDVGLTGSDEHLPTLDEALEALAPFGVNLHVEIKVDATGTPYPGLPGRVADRIAAHGVQGRVHLTSFDLDVLRACRDAAPEVPRLVSADVGWIDRRGGLDGFIAEVIDLVDIVALRHDYLAGAFDAVTARWPLDRLCVWTVNDPEAIRHWLGTGIGHLTTDRPDLAIGMRAPA